ncbi:MAG: membrane protein insertion efficiency factor YidD [Salinispira sp.]
MEFPIFRRIFTFPIILYQRVISPLFPRRCRYYPSCSEYCRRAMLTHGILRGIVLGLGRILRCWSWFAMGDDPVPERGSISELVGAYRRFYRGPGSSEAEKQEKPADIPDIRANVRE